MIGHLLVLRWAAPDLRVTEFWSGVVIHQSRSGQLPLLGQAQLIHQHDPLFVPQCLSEMG